MPNNILITGASGFLGIEIYKELSENYNITKTVRNNGACNFDFASSSQITLIDKPDLVIHSAGKAHLVPKTEKENAEFYNINYEGTRRFLSALENSKNIPKYFVFISTVAVYGLTSGTNIIENYALEAQDPYGKSKILAEKEVKEWCFKNNVICTILRLPLIVGNNPKGNLLSMITAIKSGFYLNINECKARKSMVLASDVACFIPKVAAIGGVYHLTDGHHPSILDLSLAISNFYKKGKPISLPLLAVKMAAKIGDVFGAKFPLNSSKLSKLTSDLTFNDDAAQKIGWQPKSVLDNIKLYL